MTSVELFVRSAPFTPVSRTLLMCSCISIWCFSDSGNTGGYTNNTTGSNTAQLVSTNALIQSKQQRYHTMGDRDQGKILGFTKREAEVLIVSSFWIQL